VVLYALYLRYSVTSRLRHQIGWDPIWGCDSITEAHFEISANEDKEHIVKKKIDFILPLQGEFASSKAKRSLNVDEYIGVEEVVSGGEALRIGEDDDFGDADTIEGDDAFESDYISIINSLIGHGSSRSLQFWGKIDKGDVHVLIKNDSTHNFI
nr:hypothetical protein [Tanacetum cinerariifolium]